MKTSENPIGKVVVAILIVLILQPFFCFVDAQQSRRDAVMPLMKVNNPDRNTENPMRLEILKVDIKVMGQIAVTTLDMTYYNGNSRVMEGEFTFPLGEGQTVSRFALDINGVMREGVVVEKEQGRKTFEAIVRRGIDPGLLEMTAGNNFRSRVYPLPAKGRRRIILAFEQELTDKGSYDLYQLPLKISESVEKFSIHAEIVKNKVSLDTEANELVNFSFTRWNDSYVADFEKDNYTPDKQLALAFPHIGEVPKIFTAAKNNSVDSSFFYLSLRPQIFDEAKPLPKQITLLWDNSKSAEDRDVEKELEILETYLKKIGNVTIELVPFNIKTEKPKTFVIIDGSCERLKLALKALVSDGGTSFGCIDFTRFKSDEVLLFSDGITNFGNTEPQFSGIPVYTINSSISADHAFLTYIAQRSGGVYINLNKLTTTEALPLLSRSNYHFISVQIESGKISNVYPSMPCQFTNTFSLAGIMAGKSATLKLNFGFGSRVVYTKQVKITADNSDDANLLQRLWAEKKISELSLSYEKNKDEILRTSKEFGIVTQNTSLIVLENLSDYLQYDIVPPAEMQGEYFSQKEIIRNEVSEKTKSHIDRVIELSDEQSKWWNTKFPVPPVIQSDKEVLFSPPVIVDSNVIVSEEVQEEVYEQAFIVVNEMRAAESVSGYAVNGVRLTDIQEPEAKADIQLNAWDPQTPYLKVLQYAPEGEEYNTYLKLKKEYGSTPSFYIDASDFFAKQEKKETAVKILSNLAELKLESPQLLRVLGKKLSELNSNDEAVLIFEKVLRLKGEEPQSYIDLGLAYEATGKSQKAINTLYEVVKRELDNRFPAIELIALNELNNIIALHPGLDYSSVDRRLIKKEPVDVRVVLTWDTDNCDMDLWVTDPTGEKCYYEHKLTRLGGKISNDFTNGYGPEEYMIKKAKQGEYLVQVNYFGTSSQTVLAPVNLHLSFITNFGKPDQKKQEITIRLENQKDVIDIGKFSF